MLVLGAALAASCGGGSDDGGGGNPQAPGGIDTSGVEFYFEDPHQGGRAQVMTISGAFYGRLVQVFGLDGPFGATPPPVRIPMSDGFVIEPSVVSVGGQYFLETNAVTGQDQLIILRDITDESPNGGRAQFLELLATTADNLPTVRVADVGTVGVFTMVPRNAAIVLNIDDLVDPRTIDPTTIRLGTGYPPINPFEVRILPDVHHGAFADLDGFPGPEFYPTRIIIDSTVSELEAFSTSPPLPVNSTGLPFSVDSNRANVLLSFPTRATPPRASSEC